ncbi:SNO glutamine amidotransferase [Tothia fuscella]|uniref:glutaminase n=1 Tax=Tothia fuscella TaxID=1048955 RepID=A0A9P4NT09_9PEZI|nr:SNO glutamine amidotransferase [Tothia fuscella]
MTSPITIGVLALQGAFSEHIQLLRLASQLLNPTTTTPPITWTFLEVRTPVELAKCDALIIPGGESTTMSLVAERSGMLEPLREFVKVHRNPTWGTCAGLILLSESANRTKKGGQDLIGGLDVRVNRNHFGRQVESFEAELDLPFLSSITQKASSPTNNLQPTAVHPFHSVFIRAPVVEKILPHTTGVQVDEEGKDDTVVAPSKTAGEGVGRDVIGREVEVMARLPGRAKALSDSGVLAKDVGEEGDIIAVRQGNCFGTSFHPELTGDARIHVWWLGEVVQAVNKRKEAAAV